MQLIHTIYEPSGSGPHPTILTLHGRGANAFDLLGLGPHICSGKFRLICPQGPLKTPIGPGAFGYAWYPMSPWFQSRRRDGIQPRAGESSEVCRNGRA